MAFYIEQHLEENGIKVLTGSAATEIGPHEVALSGGGSVPADLVLISAGVAPNIELAKEAGIAIGPAIAETTTGPAEWAAMFPGLARIQVSEWAREIGPCRAAM